jgi:hypothetical protein
MISVGAEFISTAALHGAVQQWISTRWGLPPKQEFKASNSSQLMVLPPPIQLKGLSSKFNYNNNTIFLG